MTKMMPSVMRRSARPHACRSFISRQVVPHDHAGAGAPGDGRHVGEHVGRALREGHGHDPRVELGGAPRARVLHTLERALAQERTVVALLEHVEEPPVEFLVHPEITWAAGLVGERSEEHTSELQSLAYL